MAVGWNHFKDASPKLQNALMVNKNEEQENYVAVTENYGSDCSFKSASSADIQKRCQMMLDGNYKSKKKTVFFLEKHIHPYELC